MVWKVRIMDKEDLVSVYQFGARFVLEQVSLFENEIDGALIGDDIEYVHRMRVASRRLRNALGVFNGFFPGNYADKWRSEMKGITKALGNARDLDIQIQLIEEKNQEMLNQKLRPGYERLLLRLKQNRTKAQEKVINSIHYLQENQTLKEIIDMLKEGSFEEKPAYTPTLYPIAQNAINHTLDTFLIYEEFIQSSNNSEKLHAMRIAGKHFRYTMEIFNPLYQEGLTPFVEIMKEIQDQLGEIHDCDVWITWLPEFTQQEKERITELYGHSRPLARLLPGIQHLIEDRTQQRQTEYKFFLANWQKLIDNQTWENLRKIIISKGESF